MGCGQSSRPVTVSSWYASDGWLKPEEEPQVTHQQTKAGMIRVTEPAKERDPTGEESLFLEQESRDIGDGMLGVADTHTIWKKIEDLSPNEAFKDDEFPADRSALFYSDKDDPSIRWSYPRQIVAKPQLLVDGVSKDDIMQVIPEPQPLYGRNYRGIVHFRFWRFGHWVDVYVDDLLPVKDKNLVYAYNSEPREFWVSLLEKAYAKLHGSYEAIEGGQAMDALVDLTGGLAERYELQEHTKELYKKLSRAAATGAFITCSRKGDWKAHSNKPDEYGLIAGHAYTVTAVKQIRRRHGKECLLRIRNPWGMGEEWKGAWCDKDDRWELVDDETKQWLQYSNKNDGEFWMSYKDFVLHFQEVTICTVGPDFDGDGEADAVGKLIVIHGSWKRDVSAGGCRNDIYSFGKNPQFLLTVHEPDEKDGALLKEEESGSSCSILVGLMQEHRRSQRHIGVKMLQIGFLIYETENPDRRLPVEHFMYNYERAKSGTYVNFREVCGRFELSPGHYIIIPTTYTKNDEGTFLLRVFSAKSISLKELPNFDPDVDMDDSPAEGTLENPEELEPPLISSAPAGAYPPSFHPNGEDSHPELRQLTQRELSA